MVEHITNAEVIAITSKVVPLVHVNAIPFIGNNLDNHISHHAGVSEYN